MESLILILLTSIFFHGVILRTKSITAGRKGPGVMQPMKDILKLWKKGSVYSKTTTLVFRLAPTINLATVFFAILMIPHRNLPGIISFNGDFVMFAYILAFGRFFSIIAALDTGSSFEGMGASREALFAMLVEPAFFLLIGSLALFTGNISFISIFKALHYETNIAFMLGGLATFVLILVALIENSRMPVDDPKTHLELTMIHEVMVLDNSGFDLGTILYTTNLKFAMYGALIANFFIGTLPLVVSALLFFAVQISFAVTVGVVESFIARFRMAHNPQFILILTSVTMLIFFGVLLVLGKFI